MASHHASGFSNWGEWPASGITTSSRAASASAMRRDGVRKGSSCSPMMTSAGRAATAAALSMRSCCSQISGASPRTSRGEHAGTCGRCTRRSPGARRSAACGRGSPEDLRDRREGRRGRRCRARARPRLAVLGRGEADLPWAVSMSTSASRRSGDGERDVLDHHPAHRVPRRVNGPTPACRRAGRRPRRGSRRSSRLGLGLRAFAVAAMVGGDRVPAEVGQPVEPFGEVLLRAREAVEEQEGTATAPASATLSSTSPTVTVGHPHCDARAGARHAGSVLGKLSVGMQPVAIEEDERQGGPRPPAMVAGGHLHPRRVPRVLPGAERLRVGRRAPRPSQRHRVRPRRDHHRLEKALGLFVEPACRWYLGLPAHGFIASGTSSTAASTSSSGRRADLAVPPQPRALPAVAQQWPSPPAGVIGFASSLMPPRLLAEPQARTPRPPRREDSASSTRSPSTRRSGRSTRASSRRSRTIRGHAQPAHRLVHVGGRRAVPDGAPPMAQGPRRAPPRGHVVLHHGDGEPLLARRRRRRDHIHRRFLVARQVTKYFAAGRAPSPTWWSPPHLSTPAPACRGSRSGRGAGLAARPECDVDVATLEWIRRRLEADPGHGRIGGGARAGIAERRLDGALGLGVQVLPDDRVVDDGRGPGAGVDSTRSTHSPRRPPRP